MGRLQYAPRARKQSVKGLVPIGFGGTEAQDNPTVKLNFTIVSEEDRAVSEGIATLDASTNIPIEQLNISDATFYDYIGIDGPKVTYVNQVCKYFITNYDSRRNYTVTATVGTVSITGNIITYTAPATAGEGGFTVNGIKVVAVSILNTAIVVYPNPALALLDTTSIILNVGETYVFNNTNYSPSITYTMSTTGGTVSAVGGVITYVAPMTPGSYAITVTSGSYSKRVFVDVLRVSPVLNVSRVDMKVSTIQTFNISNYDATDTYTVTVNGGNVSRADDVITYTAPATAGTYTIQVTGSGGTTNAIMNVDYVYYTPIASVSNLSLYTDQSTFFTITNFNSNDTYTVEATSGNALISGNTITYIAPSAPGIYSITIHGKNGSISIPVSVTFSN